MVRGAVLIAVSSMFFAIMAALARSLSGQVPAAQLVVLRFLIGLVVVAVVFLRTQTRPHFPRRSVWALRGVLGGFSVFFYFVAIERLEVGPATLLNYTAPCFAALFATLFLRERPTLFLWLGILVATTGCAVVAWSTVDPAHPFQLGLGTWAGMTSAVFGGAAMATVRSLRRDTDSPTVFLSFCTFGVVIALPMAVPVWVSMPADVLIRVLGVGLFAAAAQLLFTYAFAFITASAGSAITQLTPAFSWVLGVAWLNEQISVDALLGALLCVTGVLLSAGGPLLRAFFGREQILPASSSAERPDRQAPV